MVLGRKEAVMARVRALRQYDGKDTLEPGFNYKMTDVQAALGLCQAARLEAFLARRRAIAARYAEAVRQAGGTPPELPSGGTHGYFRFVVQLSRSVDPVLKQADVLGIACRRPVYKPLHRYLGLSGFPEADVAWERTLSIPIYPALSDDEIERIVNAIPAMLSS
jgi:perosamine synthetase